MAFADKLRDYRKSNSLTQKELADKLGLSQKTVSAWEVGRTEPTMGDIKKMCTIFDCPIEDLTDTRSRRIGEISKEDVLTKINDFPLNDLYEMLNLITARISELEEIELVKKEKQMLEKQLEDMQKRLLAYEEKLSHAKKED